MADEIKIKQEIDWNVNDIKIEPEDFPSATALNIYVEEGIYIKTEEYNPRLDEPDLIKTDCTDNKPSIHKAPEATSIKKELFEDFECEEEKIIIVKQETDLNKNRAFKCNICTKEFSSKSSLRSHSYIHNNTVYTCEVCGKIFTQRLYLKIHAKSHIIKSEVEKLQPGKDCKQHMKPLFYNCDVCGKGSTTLSSLKQHHKRQHLKIYKCDVCDKLFTRQNFLTIHKKGHK